MSMDKTEYDAIHREVQALLDGEHSGWNAAIEKAIRIVQGTKMRGATKDYLVTLLKAELKS